MTEELGFHHRFVPGERSGTLLLLHGTGGNEDDLIPLAERVAPGFNLLSPRGKVIEDGMPRFFRRLAPGVFDEQDLIERTHELAEFIGQALNHYDLQKDRIGALGYSNGANIAATLLLLHPGVLSAAGLLHAMVPLRPQRLPDLAGVPVLMTAGRSDPIVPNQQTKELAEMLENAGANLKLHWGTGGHQIDVEELDEVSRWLARDAGLV